MQYRKSIWLMFVLMVATSLLSACGGDRMTASERRELRREAVQAEAMVIADQGPFVVYRHESPSDDGTMPWNHRKCTVFVESQDGQNRHTFEFDEDFLGYESCHLLRVDDVIDFNVYEEPFSEHILKYLVPERLI